MFFALSKTLGPLTDPMSIFAILVLAGPIALWAGRRRLAAFLQLGVAAIIVFVGILPGASWLALPLETRFRPNPVLPAQVAGIIALGGTERVSAAAAWHQPLLSDPAPIATLIALGRQYPDAKLVFTGGGSRPGTTQTEAAVVRAFVAEFGIAPDRIIYEERSRNTLENSLLTRQLVDPQPRERWILITQAIAMPRAVGVFRQAGWEVIPFPAGFMTGGPYPSLVSFNGGAGLELASVAVHEWIGLIIYRLMGYTGDLFPS